MASKKNDKGEPVGWVTVKGKHFPKWADGTIGWQDGQEDIEVNNKKVTVKGNENHSQAIYRQAQEEKGESVDTKFYNSLGDARIVDESEKPNRQSAKSTNGKEEWKKGQNYTGSYTKKEEAMSDKEYEKSVYDKLRKNGWSEKMAKAEAAEQVKVRNDDLGGVRPIKKQASMELGNGLRLTADVSNPNKNISEVERAKKVNREKQYADKKLNQYRKAAQEEKAKAQSIADAISAKTGIANTGSRNAKYDTSRATKKNGATAEDIARDKETFRKAKEHEAKVKTKAQASKQAVRDAKAAIKQYGPSRGMWKDVEKADEAWNKISKAFSHGEISQEAYTEAYHLFGENFHRAYKTRHKKK